MLVPWVGHHSCNRHGRDFVVGDVHGCFRTLERALASLSFDDSRDRLFGVGDLVERGPHSSEALDWIERRFTAITLGNHEAAALRWLRARLKGSREATYGWLCSIGSDAYPRWRDAFLAMPLAVTIETPHGDVGVIHADSPHPSWPNALRLLERGHDLDIALFGFPFPEATCGRYRARPVEGVRALVHGHNRACCDIDRAHQGGRLGSLRARDRNALVDQRRLHDEEGNEDHGRNCRPQAGIWQLRETLKTNGRHWTSDASGNCGDDLIPIQADNPDAFPP